MYYLKVTHECGPPPHVEQPTTKIGQQDMTKHNTQKISEQNNNNEIQHNTILTIFCPKSIELLAPVFISGSKIENGLWNFRRDIFRCPTVRIKF